MQRPSSLRHVTCPRQSDRWTLRRLAARSISVHSNATISPSRSPASPPSGGTPDVEMKIQSCSLTCSRAPTTSRKRGMPAWRPRRLSARRDACGLNESCDLLPDRHTLSDSSGRVPRGRDLQGSAVERRHYWNIWTGNRLRSLVGARYADCLAVAPGGSISSGYSACT